MSHRLQPSLLHESAGAASLVEEESIVSDGSAIRNLASLDQT